MRPTTLVLAILLASCANFARAQEFPLPRVGLKILWELDSFGPVRSDFELIEEIIAVSGNTIEVRRQERRYPNRVAQPLKMVMLFPAIPLLIEGAGIRTVISISSADSRLVAELPTRRNVHVTLSSAYTRRAGNGQSEQTGTNLLQTDLAVIATQRIRVEAGEFDTELIERRVVSRDDLGREVQRETARFWYAPSLGWYVRTEHVTELPARRRLVYYAKRIEQP